MNEQIKKLQRFIHLPVLINLIISVYCFVSIGHSQFLGYIIGVVLCYLLSIVWFFQVKKGVSANAFSLFKLIFGGFILKVAFFLIFIFIVFQIYSFNRYYFSAAFLIGTLLSLVMEVKFYFSIINLGKNN